MLLLLKVNIIGIHLPQVEVPLIFHLFRGLLRLFLIGTHDFMQLFLEDICFHLIGVIKDGHMSALMRSALQAELFL